MEITLRFELQEDMTPFYLALRTANLGAYNGVFAENDKIYYDENRGFKIEKGGVFAATDKLSPYGVGVVPFTTFIEVDS
jgi:hypothetical protein